ncbi:hypothetical protein ABW19_dt0203047 [Dactylella cylindrospora]|nr:hypothetical protein ABW19_dt0203047 [Dactylella cylindrospora]
MEPLTSQDWTDFGALIGRTPQPEHLRLHNPAWNLSLMKVVTKDRWKAKGKEGSPPPPGAISTQSREQPPSEVVEMDIDEPGLSATVVAEGRKRKVVNYRIPGLGPNFEDDEEDMGVEGFPIVASHRKRRLKYPGEELDDDSTGYKPSSRHAAVTSMPMTPKLPYSGKKRGRPRKIRTPEVGMDGLAIPSTEDDVMRDMQPLSSPLSKPPISQNTYKPVVLSAPDAQRRRRLALIAAAKKIDDTDWSKRLTITSRESTTHKESPKTPKTRDFDKNVVESNNLISKHKVGRPRSWLPSSSPSNTLEELPRFPVGSTPSRKPSLPLPIVTTVQDQLNREMSLIRSSSSHLPSSQREPSPILGMDEASSPSTVYESGPSSPLHETTYPAGVLRLSGLPFAIRNLIPSNREFFSRSEHISPLIGGNPRTMVCIVKRAPTASPITTTGYLAASPVWNPHLPKVPGDNGSIIQLGKHTLDPISNSQSDFPLFVFRDKSKWEYCGQYVVAEVAEFSPFERWMHLVDSNGGLKRYWAEEIVAKKFTWPKELLMKRCGWTEEFWNKELTVEKVMEVLEKGTVPMNWMHLRCVGWETALYEGLVAKKQGRKG